MNDWTPPARRPRIAVVGVVSWDRLLVLDRVPSHGDFAMVLDEREAIGGTSSNAAVAAARLGAAVAIASATGDDPEGRNLRLGLEREGIDREWLQIHPGEPTDRATVLVGGDPAERTILWHRGAHLVRGDRLDIAGLFDNDVVLLDVDDPPLRRFLVDLPAHTAPAARLLGTLTYLVDSGMPDALDVALRHDVLVGNEREAIALTGATSSNDMLARLQRQMVGANLRAAIVTRGKAGATAITQCERWDVPAPVVDCVDPTGAGDAFAGAVAYAMACRWAWPDATRFANAVAAISTTAIGAQAALPTLAGVARLLARQPAD